jgi:hypothetical protein
MGGTTQIQPPPSKTKALYDEVSKEYNVGTFDEFDKKLQDPAKRKAFYDGVGKQYDLGSFKDFEQKISGPKKKEDTVGSPFPSGSLPKPVPTEPPVGIGGSDPKQVTANYKNNSLTAADVDQKPTGGTPGPSPEQVSNAINNKGKNIDKWANSPSNLSSSFLVKEKQDVDGQIAQMDSFNSRKLAYGAGKSEEFEKQLNDLKAKRDYLSGEIGKNYNYEKGHLVPELVDQLKGQVDDSEFDPQTHQLRPISVEWVARHVDDIMNKKNNSVVNAAVSGDLDDKKRTYADLTKSVIDQLNLIPIQKAQHQFAKEYADKHPEIKEALNANEEVHDYFSTGKFDDVKAKVKIQTDKGFINTQNRYYGEGGIFPKNQDYVGIMHKYAQLVHDGKMSDEVARKQMDAEVNQNPALKKIKGNFDSEIKKVIENSQKQYEGYVVEGLQKKHPQYTVYSDGTPGLASIPEDKFKKLIGGYREGMDGIAKEMGAETNEAFKRQANAKAEAQGPFFGSLAASTNALMSGLTKMVFNKTGWGGDHVRNFEASEIASPNASQSDVAATWNWKGYESLVNPNFYLSGLGGMVPVIAGGAAVTATTEGSGLPEYVGWLANAGLFTAQSSLSTYDQLLNTKDANGNMLSESDAAHFTADQAAKDFLPNVLMMAMTSGTLLKAKGIAKPTVLGTVGKAALGAVEAQPFFTWQGYNDYATLLKAQGKTPDIYDYMQSKEFRDNMVNGLVLGGGLSLLHAPFNHFKAVDNYEKLIHTSEGEFKNMLPQNYVLGQEMAGNGDYMRDALKMHVFNVDPSSLNEEGKKNLKDLQVAMKYSVNLDRNIKSGNLDRTNVNDLYQAHNLALADQHDYLSEQAAKEGNKNLSDIYKDKAKDYREQAKASANDQAKFHYLINDEGHPIFMSDNSFKVLDKEGKIGQWLKDGTVKEVVKSDDPEFGQRYKDHVITKDEATVEGKDLKDHAAALVEQNKAKLGSFYFQAKADPEGFLNTVSGAVKENEATAREQYGDDIVDLAKVVHPEEVRPESETPSAGPDEQKAGQSDGEAEYKRTITDDPFADQFFPDGSPEREAYDKLDEKGKDDMIDAKRYEFKERDFLSKHDFIDLKEAKKFYTPSDYLNHLEKTGVVKIECD